jgi:hypothetical protein
VTTYTEAERMIIDQDAAVAPFYHRATNVLVQPWVSGLTLTGIDAVPGDLSYYLVKILAH